MRRLGGSLRRRGVALFCGALLGLAFAPTALATPEQKADDKKGGDDAFADLFGAPAATGGDLKSLREATQGVKKGGGGDGLKPKAAKIRDGVTVTFPMIFAAERIRLDRKVGCVPSPKAAVKIKEFRFSQLPASTPRFSVCVRMQSDVGRQMRMSVSIVGPRMRSVASAQSVASFLGKDELDHILDFPELTFIRPGVYSYVVDLDGKRVAKIPLFTVNIGEVP